MRGCRVAPRIRNRGFIWVPPRPTKPSVAPGSVSWRQTSGNEKMLPFVRSTSSVNLYATPMVSTICIEVECAALPAKGLTNDELYLYELKESEAVATAFFNGSATSSLLGLLLAISFFL